MPGANNGFQTFVNNLPPPAVPGDWAGANIRASVVTSPWQLVASPAGVSVGVIAWADPATGYGSTYFRPSSFAGFVHREQQAIITAYLGIASQLIPSGDAVDLQAQGDWWGLFQSGATAGQKVYANPTTGALTGDATGNSVSATGGDGTISGTTLTVTTTPTSGSLAVGQIIDMAGVPVGTYLASGSGTSWTLANLDGTAIPAVGSATSFTAYGVQETQFYVAQTVPAAASFTATLAKPATGVAYGILTVSAVGSGTLSPGDYITSSGTVAVPGTANIQILDQLTGTTGSTGTYQTNNTYYDVSSGQTFVTAFGQMAKISSWSNWQ